MTENVNLHVQIDVPFSLWINQPVMMTWLTLMRLVLQEITNQTFMWDAENGENVVILRLKITPEE